MKKIEELLATKKAFSVDHIACMLHAEIIKKYERPYEIFSWSGETKEVQLFFKVAFISICHQFSWDFLQAKLAHHILQKNEDPLDIVSNVTSKEIATWLSDYPKKERIREKERARILRNVGNVIKEKFNSSLSDFYEECSKASLQNGDFHKLLDNFEGYKSDPLRKKTNVLSHDLLKEDIIKFTDKDFIRPAIDYHIMRLYLRTGRVVATHPIVLDFLKGAPNPRGSLVQQLRSTVSEAEILTAHYSNLNVADVNYIEWQIGRSICRNINPACEYSKSTANNLPADVKKLCFKKNCPYKEICLSFNNMPEFLTLEEPKYISTYY